jgi:hypothetical protein
MQLGCTSAKGAFWMQSRELQIDGVTVIEFTFDPVLDQAQAAGMAEVVEAAIAREEELRLLLDLRGTQSFALGAFVSPKGFLASLRSIGPVSRYAVVGAPALADAAVESFGAILPLEARAFRAEDYPAARQWVGAARA